MAREAAAIVLADDHFATIVRAIREGRRIHDNIRRFVLYLLRANLDELLLLLTALVLALPLPLLPLHLLWINLATDGLPALALATEREAPDVMRRPPRSPTAPLLAGAELQLALAAVAGFGVALGAFLVGLAWEVPLDRLRTFVLTLVIAVELAQAYSSRSERPVWEVGVFSNPAMNRAVLLVGAVQLLMITTPAGAVLRLSPLSLAEVAAATALALVTVGLQELLKLGRGAPPTR